MKRTVVCVTVVLAGLCAAARAADEPSLDEVRLRTLAARDRRFARALELARMYAGVGRLEDARRLYEEALETHGDDVDVAEALLKVLRELDDHEAQLPLYRRLSSTRPGDPELHLEMGVCLWRLGRADEARKTWDALLKRFPAERTVYDDLVDVHIADGRVADARRVLDRRRERFGEDTHVLLTEARLAVTAGKPGDALPMLLDCLERDLSESDSRRAEFLVLILGRETGRGADVRRRLEARLRTVDAQLAGRLLDLAAQAAARGNFARAAALGERALPLIADAKKRAEVSSRVALVGACASPNSTIATLDATTPAVSTRRMSRVSRATAAPPPASRRTSSDVNPPSGPTRIKSDFTPPCPARTSGSGGAASSGDRMTARSNASISRARSARALGGSTVVTVSRPDCSEAATQIFRQRSSLCEWPVSGPGLTTERRARRGTMRRTPSSAHMRTSVSIRLPLGTAHARVSSSAGCRRSWVRPRTHASPDRRDRRSMRASTSPPVPSNSTTSLPDDTPSTCR